MPSASSVQYPKHSPIIREQLWVEAAHSVMSSFGRPCGWFLKIKNWSVVNALLTLAQQEKVYMAWKLIKLSEWQPSQHGLDGCVPTAAAAVETTRKVSANPEHGG
mmetsp:Transcript_5027/g.14652  ORF Transcript_5027/g.14652 Transcript_5027/m.14652 type:complete len:105 (+) Transcript_5027:613-927(+)